MKNYNETINTVFDRINDYEVSKKRKHKTVARVVTSCCCVCLIALMGFGLFQSGIIDSKPPISSNGPNSIKENEDLIIPDTTSPLIEEETPNTPPKDDDFNPTQNDNTTTENNPDNSIKWLCYVNQIDGTASGAPLYLDPAKHYTQNLNNDEIATYFGKNLCSIGADYKYTGPDFHTVTYNNENVLVRDTASFSYAYANTSFTVMASKITTPYDCIYALEEQRITKVGTANGPVDVLFAATVGGNEKQPEIQKLMVADFQYNRVYYRVTAENISVTDFYNIVRSILK